MQVFLVQETQRKRVEFVSPTREGAIAWGAEHLGGNDISGLPESQWDFDVVEFEVGTQGNERITRYTVYADWPSDEEADTTEYEVVVVDDRYQRVLTEVLAVA